MVEFAVFDYLLDSVFIVDGDGKIVYCNEMAATLCQSSVRRLSGKALFQDVLEFTEPGLLPFTAESHGRTAPSPQIETAYTFKKFEKAGKTQLTVRPMGDGLHWVFFMHDVSLEETLAAKYKAELQKTEEYARSLEKMVEARTAELRKVNQTLNAILDSLGQGFFTFNKDGQCGEVFTKACKEILEKLPKGLKAEAALGVPASEASTFHKWTEQLFKEPLPFDDLKSLGPSTYPHSESRHVVLEYYPIRQANEISDVVVVATDKTAEREAQLALEEERQYAGMVVKYLKNKDQFNQFLGSVRTERQHLMDLAVSPLNEAQIAESFRILHTIEGEAGTFSVRELRTASRASQQVLEPFRNGAKMETWDHELYLKSLREFGAAFEKFLEDNKSIIELKTGSQSRTVEVPTDTLSGFFAELQKIPAAAALVHQGQDLFLKEPIGTRFKYFDGLIQSVAEKLDKKIKPLVIEGGDLRIFPEPYQPIFSALVHAFRNAVDHGLEGPDDRQWGGKDPAGQITVRVRGEDKGGIHIEIQDDGRGIDPAVIREKLAAKFPNEDFAKMSDQDIVQRVCMPGFSSRDEVGEFSGRGVGLDALREEVVKTGGTLFVESKVGQGTCIKMYIPPLQIQLELLRSA
jgi:two-component system chemotaxis sensor kinase CheA